MKLQEETGVMKLLCIGFYNIRHGEGIDGVVDLERIAGVIQEMGCDIAFFTEVDDGWPRSGWVNQAYALAAALQMPHYRYAPAMELSHMRDGKAVPSRYGNLVTSRYPIVTTDVLPLPPGSGEPRVALAVGIRVGNRTLRLLGTHLGLTPHERQIQAETIADYLRQNPVDVLVGDLNAEIDAPSLAPLLEATKMVPPCQPNEMPKTFPADKPETAIDHIWVQPELLSAVQGFEVVKTEASDHFPLLLALRW